MSDQMNLLIKAVTEAKEVIVKHLMRLSTYQENSVSIAGASAATSTVVGNLEVTPE